MPQSENQKLKILYLYRILLTQTDDTHDLSVPELIEALEKEDIQAERKAIYRDLEALKQFGLDIEQIRGPGRVGYYVAQRRFALPELKLLVDAVQSSRFITKKKTSELIRKLESLASNHEAKQLQRQVFVSNRVKSENETIYYGVDLVHSAILENRQITFQYFDWNEAKRRVLRHDGKIYTVSPWALCWNDENYYLIAYETASDQIRHYRVDKMLHTALTQQKRDGADRFSAFDMAVYSRSVFGMYGGEETLVTLRCANRLSGVMLDRFGSDMTFLPARDGTFSFSVRVQISPPFLTWLMNFGRDVTILSPQEVVSRFCETARAALSQYTDES